MRDEIIAVNTLTDAININIKSIYKTLGEAGDIYKCNWGGTLYYCYVFVEKGKIELKTLQSYCLELNEGQAVFLWANDIQSYSFSESTSYFWAFFSLTEQKLPLMKPFALENTSKTASDLYRCITLINRGAALELFRANMIFTNNVLKGIEKLLLDEEKSKTWAQRSIESSLNFIRDNLYALPMIQELANQAGMSLKQYRKYFKKIVGVYPAQYIYEQKLLLVREYLANTDLTVAQISDMIGYSSPYYLSFCFKKYFGITPREYRVKTKE